MVNKLLRRTTVSAGVLLLLAVLGRIAPPAILLARAVIPGGFLESADSTNVRARLTPAQIATFMPTRGTFTFPAPYLTQRVPLTNSTDCAGRGDCINPVGYSYWRNINNHVASNTMYFFLGTNLNAGGVGPILL